MPLFMTMWGINKMNGKNTLLIMSVASVLFASSGLFAAAKARAASAAKRQAQAAQARAARAQARAARAGIAGAAKEEQDLQAAIRASLQEVSGAGEETKVSAAEFEAARVAAAQAAAVAKRAEIQEKREAAQAAAVARRAEAQEKMAARRAQGGGAQQIPRTPMQDITRSVVLPASKPEISQSKSSEVCVVKVAPQQAAECGYHAVINTANAVLSVVSGENALPYSISELKQFITGIRNDKNDQWLDTIEVVKLARDVYNLPTQDFSVIGDITGQIYRNFLAQDTIDAIKKLQTSDGTIHGFIIGSMRQEGGRGVMGHWISVVARRDAGVIHYDVRDSAAGSGANSAMVNALIDLVSANPADLTLGSETLSLEMMRDIRLDFDGYFYDAMLDKIAKLLAIVEQASRAGQQKFKVDLEQLRTYLSQMNDELLADENRNLKDTLVTIINGYLE